MDDLSDAMSALKDITAIADNDHAKLSEVEFKTKFLPLLLSNESVDLRAWVAIAGHAGRCVDIVRGNEVLYTVPPLLNFKGMTNTNRRPQDSIDERVQEAVKKSRNMPNRTKDIIVSEVGKVITPPISNESAEQMWEIVLKANGLSTSPDIKAIKGSTHDPIVLEDGDDL